LNYENVKQKAKFKLQAQLKCKLTQPPPITLPYALQSFEVDDFITFGRDELPADLDRLKRDLRLT